MALALLVPSPAWATLPLLQIDPETRCMADAIAYEAGSEPPAGQEAVAQVILNRLRDPAYPKSVCGVVYQGSKRRNGCQFTFTCDGALFRVLPKRIRATAAETARRALGGELAETVPGATHYHADYVTPAWAHQLVRIGMIGRHIFYRPGVAPLPPSPPPTSPITESAFSAWGITVAPSHN